MGNDIATQFSELGPLGEPKVLIREEFRKALEWDFEDEARNKLPFLVEYVLNQTKQEKLSFIG